MDLEEAVSNTRLDDWFRKHGNHSIVVATGFIAKNMEVCRGEGGQGKHSIVVATGFIANDMESRGGEEEGGRGEEAISIINQHV